MNAALQRLKANLVFVPTLLWNMLLGRWLKVRRWWDRIDDTVIIGALPLAADVRQLAELGVTAVVNTCAEYEGPMEEYEKFGITQFRMPTVDFTHPRLEDVRRAVGFIAQQTADGSTTYVHCKAGRARSATVVMCWLMQSKGMTPEQAQKLLLEKRPHINRHLASRPVVRQFYQQLPAKKSD